MQERRLVEGALKLDFISECSSKCGCNDLKCGNRSVQNTVVKKWNLSIEKKRSNKIWSLYTKDFIPKGSYLFEYIGEII